MAAVTAEPFALFQGESKVLAVTVASSGGLAGASADWGLAAIPLDGTTAIAKAGAVVDAAAGLVEVTITRAETAALAPGWYEWQLYVDGASGNRTAVANGRIMIRTAVT